MNDIFEAFRVLYVLTHWLLVDACSSIYVKHSISRTKYKPELLSPGLKVLHFPDIDYRTHYYTFTDALNAVKAWSDQNPNHIPIFILIEA